MFIQGDIVSVNFPFTDSSVIKKRPALIISNHKVNQTGDYLLAQITSKSRHDDLSISIKKGDYENQELPLKSYVRFHKIFLLNESFILRKVSSVNTNFKISVFTKIADLLKVKM
jgi:mRNA interferase MazF